MKTKKALLIVSVLVIILAPSIMVYSIGMMGKVNNFFVGCEEISEYYTGNDFYTDWSNLIARVYENMDYNLTSNDRIFNIYAPKDIIWGNDFDCKSISNAIYCLAKEYNITCKFKTEIEFFEGFQNMSGHLGIWCYDVDLEKWAKLN